MRPVTELDDLASTILGQRARRENIAFPPGTVLSTAELYAVQDRVTAALGDGAPPAAYKVSWLPLVLVDTPADQPCFAGIPAGRIFDNGARVDGSDRRRLGFEIEIACRLGLDDAGAVRPVSAILGLEVIEEHSDAVDKETIRALLAGGMFNYGYVVGPELSGWKDLTALTVSATKNGEPILTTTIGAVFDPNERLAAFLDHARTIGWTVADGTIVSLGALNRDVWFSPGDAIVAEAPDFGRVEASLA